jgi:hypothetical protein
VGRFRLGNELVVKLLAFTGAACGVIAQAEAFPDEVRFIAAAIAAGCLAVLSLSRQPGQNNDSRPGGQRG